MKKIKYIFILFIAVLTVSCDDYLNVESPSQFDNNYVFESEDEILRAIGGIYEPIIRVYSGRWITAFLPNNDVEFNDVSDVESAKGQDYACYTPASYNSDMTDIPAWLYKAVNLSNLVIDGIENSSLYANTDKTKPSNLMQLYGETKTLRAMLYLDLVRTWGDVPFLLKPSSSDDDMQVVPTDRDEILTTMITDLISVEPVMKYAKENTYGVERPSREFCQGLIALMALTRGGYSLRPIKEDPTKTGVMQRNEDYLEYYKIAETYAGKAIASNTHELSMGFEEFWKTVCNYKTVDNDDFIFDIPVLKGSLSGEYCYYIGIPMDAGDNNPYGKCGGGYSLSVPYMLSFDEDDIRRDVTCICYKYDSNLNQTGPTLGASMLGGVKVGKYRRMWMETPLGPTTAKNTGINVSYMRYADILLMYAEAANEVNNGPTEAAKEALKQVRKRAFSAVHWNKKVEEYVNSKSDKESFFNAIVNERKWEFGGENKRKYDLARWNLFGKVVCDFYKNAIAMGKSANGIEINEWNEIPDYIYYKQVSSTERPGKKDMKFHGLYKRVAAPDQSEKYSSKALAASYYVQDKTTGEWGVCETLKRCFRGYFTPDTFYLIDPERDPVRYFLPWGTAFMASNPNLNNYYGFK
ncbi:RagB/SusD family nutrient uptake outer membrane protein [Bacteroides thetaiotaomicron]|uniref:RagB/SusD family nutrient uptake outer membrane protein n=1 Tax=Bacteroides thetaiotaomicron TaxID=818 RepID=UPI00232E9542|nr:RagB/SusD family nutrient uptake outer membrane protein [Bacteroides thetaiotaomicron]MDC2256123.1 RagB/SusD family nutrient uptake outer membrane protein [Bacteroides thetaiotaomicron]MDC2260904.1 RagB/SusD family nutrient uptake outer membrane protein [Bacteroides thetaiotaomicron]